MFSYCGSKFALSGIPYNDSVQHWANTTIQTAGIRDCRLSRTSCSNSSRSELHFRSCIRKQILLSWQDHGIVKRKTSRTFAKVSPKKTAGEPPGEVQGMRPENQNWCGTLIFHLEGLDASEEESVEIVEEEEEEESEFEDDMEVRSSKLIPWFGSSMSNTPQRFLTLYLNGGWPSTTGTWTC